MMFAQATNALVAATGVVDQVTGALGQQADQGREFVQQITTWLAQNGVSFALNAIGAILILIVGGLAVKLLVAALSRALLKAMDYGSQKSNYEYVAQLVADQTATDYEINFYQTEDSLWFNQELLRSYLEDGTLKGYFETQQQNFIDTEVLTADDATDVENYVLFDVIEEALQGN